MSIQNANHSDNFGLGWKDGRREPTRQGVVVMGRCSMPRLLELFAFFLILSLKYTVLSEALVRLSSGQTKTGPNTVDKYMASDLWLSQVVELNLIQLVFRRFPGMMAFSQSTFGVQV